jgi:hypothetical protein
MENLPHASSPVQGSLIICAMAIFPDRGLTPINAIPWRNDGPESFRERLNHGSMIRSGFFGLDRKKRTKQKRGFKQAIKRA